MRLTIHIHLLLRLRMSEAIPSIPLIYLFTFLQYVQSLSWHSCVSTSINLLAINLDILNFSTSFV